MAKAKSAVDDPVLAELVKQRDETLAKINAKISERKRRMQGQERKNRNRLLMLTGIAYHADAELHPEVEAQIRATLARAITSEKDRAFLKSIGWIKETGRGNTGGGQGAQSKDKAPAEAEASTGG